MVFFDANHGQTTRSWQVGALFHGQNQVRFVPAQQFEFGATNTLDRRSKFRVVDDGHARAGHGLRTRIVYDHVFNVHIGAESSAPGTDVF